jgi:ABC-type branched-subunit amino acid transport system ATPase component
MSLLRIDGVDVHIQSSQILRGVSLRVEPCEVVCLVGRNGAGKTTLFQSVLGLSRIARGSIAIGGEPAAGWTPARRPVRSPTFHRTCAASCST